MLPKLKHPTFEFTIPSTNKKELFRPFLVKDEKVLLMAKTSNESSDIFRAIKQVVNNCAISESFDIDKLAIFDLEYLFLKIRSVSVNNIVKVSYRDNEDGEVYDIEVDLSNIEVKFPENINSKIKILDSLGLTMKYPSASLFDDRPFLNSGDNAYFELILRSIDKIYDSDSVYDPSNFSKEELEGFLDQLDTKTFEDIQKFIDNIPKLSHQIKYVNKNGNERTIEMSSLSDFFTLG